MAKDHIRTGSLLLTHLSHVLQPPQQPIAQGARTGGNQDLKVLKDSIIQKQILNNGTHTQFE